MMLSWRRQQALYRSSPDLQAHKSTRGRVRPKRRPKQYGQAREATAPAAAVPAASAQLAERALEDPAERQGAKETASKHVPSWLSSRLGGL